jgi:hypothetical protein
MTLISDLAETFDERGCTGLTIWIDNDKNVQISMRASDRVSWDVEVGANLRPALVNAIARFLKNNPPVPERSRRNPVSLAKRRAEASDLI